MEAERRCLGDPVRCKQGDDIEAVGEELQRQTAMLASAIEDALDAVIKNKGRRCLVRRRSNLEAALENYERAIISPCLVSHTITREQSRRGKCY